MALINFDEYLETLESDPRHQADILLLTCMDFRFFTKISEKMKGKKYDHVILAGAALGVVSGRKQHWYDTFFDHLNLAIKLHGVNRVIVMEHRECGAYGPPPGFGLLPEKPEREHERKVHFEQVEKLRKEMPLIFSGLTAFLLEVPETTQECTFDQLI